jgi:hypothetical protein
MTTYNNPVPKRRLIATFFRVGIRSFQTVLTGRSRIATSEMMLKIAVDKMIARYSKQCPPPVYNLFQIFSRGKHAKIVRNVVMV